MLPTVSLKQSSTDSGWLPSYELDGNFESAFFVVLFNVN